MRTSIVLDDELVYDDEDFDRDGDGDLEVVVQTFDHAMDVFTVPGSGTNCMLWPTARGGPLRTGAPSGHAGIFADGFESGGTSRWSHVSP